MLGVVCRMGGRLCVGCGVGGGGSCGACVLWHRGRCRSAPCHPRLHRLPAHTLTHTHCTRRTPHTLPQENLRQLCVFTIANATGRPYLWWDYVTLFGEQCAMETKQYGQECAEKVRLLCTVCAWRVACGMPSAAGLH